jgi:hypothetical protein
VRPNNSALPTPVATRIAAEASELRMLRGFRNRWQQCICLRYSFLHPREGGDGAPDLQESLQNLGINSGVLAVLLTVLIQDRIKASKEKGVIEREEVLGRLMVTEPPLFHPLLSRSHRCSCRAGKLSGAWAQTPRLSTSAQVNVNDERNVTLQTLRGFARPLIIAGTRSHVQRAMKAAEPYRNAIKDRGIERGLRYILFLSSPFFRPLSDSLTFSSLCFTHAHTLSLSLISDPHSLRISLHIHTCISLLLFSLSLCFTHIHILSLSIYIYIRPTNPHFL